MTVNHSDTSSEEAYQQSCEALSKSLGRELLQQGLVLGTAESCTGGMIAAAITDTAGSSAWFEEGLVTYANQSKQRLLGVDEAVLDQHGAVSRPVVEAMVAGVLARGADVAVATSGIAGPDGGSADKPVGTVWLAWGTAQGTHSQCEVFAGNRRQVREQAVLFALNGLMEQLQAAG
ncbi:CinA family protein [Pseudomaricurvus alkylphenolicus]|uniref:CinA family protein n=1 Tax=Pseudomaricurvus alkylphenolicus TaxID=1306991 RepID=UPI001423A9A2|nr:CinA family protein [Pseudomaricurvus alkylphenolicus]NIB39688.1 CinA family protein [Pseudomaricurvus alkylphenolicus]